MHALNLMAVTPMRILPFLLLFGFSAATFAEDRKPADLEPLSPPPRMTVDQAADLDEPEVTITEKKEQTVEEYRAGGKLYMIKITPKVGPPYYLVDDRGDGKFTRQESLDSGLRPPRWVIKKF